MDLLFKRYASPYVLCDQMIFAENFLSFVQNLEEVTNEEKLWDFYLHKVLGEQSFEEFKGSLSGKQKNQTKMSDSEIETTITNSFDIVNGFVLDENFEERG
jgi:hypothetical protein